MTSVLFSHLPHNDPSWSFESSLDFVDPFLGFRSISLTFVWDFTKFRWPFWAFVKCLNSNQLMTQAVSQRLESIHGSTGFPGIDSESTHDSSGFPRYWFRLTHDSVLPHFSIQMNSWLKRKAFDSDSTHASTQSHTHLWFEASCTILWQLASTVLWISSWLKWHPPDASEASTVTGSTESECGGQNYYFFSKNISDLSFILCSFKTKWPKSEGSTDLEVD